MTRAFREHVYKSPDGLDLYARIYDGDPNHTPLLCLHGLTRNSADFHDLLTALPDWPAISVDQRGRGQSASDPDPTRYKPDVYCADMLSLLDGLSLTQVIAIGTSMGGIMTFILANMRPGLFKAAIINDIGPEVDPAGLRRLGRYVGQTMSFADWDAAVAAIQSQGPDIFPDFTTDDWHAFARNVCAQAPDGTVRFAYDPAIGDSLKDQDPSAVPPNLWPLFQKPSDFPMLIVRGETSDILSAKTAARMVSDRPNVTLTTVPNRGHAPTLTEPTALQAITQFLSAQL
jgi:pimeloyl-ACP methyl ester carboxylesterase